VVASDSRSQFKNRDAALERLTELLRRNLHVAKPRKKTRPTKASRERRLTEKKRRGTIKRDRRRPAGDD
jgi:ribosome-associated protein